MLYEALKRDRRRQRPDADRSATCRPCSARATAGCPSGTRARAWPSTSEQGYLPEALLNYLALLGWAIADDRDIFSLDEMVEAFDILRVNANPARFDAKKCEAINASHIRLLAPAELTEALVPFLVRAGLVSDPPLPDERELLAAATPLVQERMNTLVARPSTCSASCSAPTTRSPSTRPPL